MTVKFATMKDLKERTRWVFERAKRADGVALTLRGRVVGLLQPMTEEELEAFIVSQSRHVKKLLALARKQELQGLERDFEEVLKELGEAR